MPIRPIDLQTMLMQLSQVGREQSAEKEGAALQVAMKVAADTKRLDESKESVHRAEDAEAGAKILGDRDGSPGQPPREGPGGRREAGPKDGEKAKEEVIRDPGLGTRIDLEG
jgi:hypothetical protein